MSTIVLGYEPESIPEGVEERIRELAPGMQLLVTEDRAQIERALVDVEVAVRRFPRDLLPRASGLRWYQQWGAGADWLLRYPELAQLDFVLTNASGVHPVQITEHILALMLSFARQLPRAFGAQARGEWRRPERDGFSARQPITELYEKTLLLVGVGAIGERTAQIASAMGMRVLGIRRNPSVASAAVDAMYGAQELGSLLGLADFVVLTVPLTAETRGLIGEAELRAMKPSAYLVNIGRGGTIDERALAKALQEGWIAGAGLDVFETEPLPAASPLWGLDNLIITAHYAGRSPHYEERALEIFYDNLARYVSGQPLRNVVDKQLGY